MSSGPPPLPLIEYPPWLRELSEARGSRESEPPAPSVPAADARRETARAFYAAGGWPPERIAKHLDGIDFDKPVAVVTLAAGTTVVQYQRPGAPVGNYFAPPGTPPEALGIYPAGRVGVEFVVTAPVQVLQTTAAPIVDTWSVPGEPHPVAGGGTQFFTTDPGPFAKGGAGG